MMVSNQESLKSFDIDKTNNQNPDLYDASNFHSGGTCKSSVTPKLGTTLLPDFGDLAQQLWIPLQTERCLFPSLTMALSGTMTFVPLS